MVEPQIRYDDGAGYERYMGYWSRLAGETFLDWLAPPPGLRWIDIGCGTGAFTELLVKRCAPAAVQGIDPSEAQLGFARARSAASMVAFRQGDAMSLPFSDRRFDAATMALVIFFVPIRPKASQRWCGWFARVAWSRPMRGIYWVADFLWTQSRPKCAQWALILCSPRVPMHLERKPCGACGQMQALMRSRRDRLQCVEHFLISMTSGRSACWQRVFDR
jgi:SAM-dependent methyltransferase